MRCAECVGGVGRCAGEVCRVVHQCALHSALLCTGGGVEHCTAQCTALHCGGGVEQCTVEVEWSLPAEYMSGSGSCRASRLSPYTNSYTLHPTPPPTPYTLHPTPYPNYNLHPTLYTNPYTLHHCTLNMSLLSHPSPFADHCTVKQYHTSL